MGFINEYFFKKEYHEIPVGTKFRNYLKKEDVNSQNCQEEVISLADFYKIVKIELKELNDVIVNNCELIKKCEKILFHLINEDTCRYMWLKHERDSCEKYVITRGLNSSFYQSTEIVIQDKFNLKTGKDKDDVQRNFYNYVYDIYKFNDIDELYLSKKECRYHYDFVKENYDTLLNLLITIEKYIDLLGELKKFKINFSDDLFIANLSISEIGEVDINIERNENNVDSFIYSNLFKFIELNKWRILNKIPVFIKELEEPFFSIYNKHINKKSNKVKNYK